MVIYFYVFKDIYNKINCQTKFKNMSNQIRREKQRLIYERHMLILDESKNSLETILALEGENLYRAIAASMVDLERNGSVLTEGSRLLKEWEWLDKIKNKFKNLWSDANAEYKKKSGENLSPEQQKALQHAQMRLAQLARGCENRIKRQTEGDITEEDLAEFREDCVKRALSSDKGKSIIGKLNHFFKNTIAGKTITLMLMAGAIVMATGLANTHTDSVDDGPHTPQGGDGQIDTNVSHIVKVNTHGSVDVHQDGSVHQTDDSSTVGSIQRDFAKTDVNQQQVDQTINNILKVIQHTTADKDVSQIKSVNIDINSNYSNTDGSQDSNDNGINDSNDCGGAPCAETHNQSVSDSIKQGVEQGLNKLGLDVKVNYNSHIGGLASDQVSANSGDADAQQNTTVHLHIDTDQATDNTSHSETTPGLLYPFVNTGPSAKAATCQITNKNTGEKVSLREKDNIHIRGVLKGDKFVPSSNGKVYKGTILGGNEDKSKKEINMVVLFTIDGKKYETKINCGGEYDLGNEKGNEKGGEDGGNEKGGEKGNEKGREEGGGENGGDVKPLPVVPQDFLKGNRNMQLAYLSELFLPQGKGLWNSLGLKRGTVIPSGFLDAALGQGKKDSGKYLKAYYNHLKKEDSFTKDPGNSGAWLAKVQANETQALIKWVRNTRKNIGPFLKALKNEFPEFSIGERSKAKTIKPGKRGEAMGTSGINDSIKNRLDNLLTEDFNIGGSAVKAGFDKTIFMKNLPQFMEMISSMYYGIKGSKLPYDKEGVLKVCKPFGCKAGSGSGYTKTKSDDYVLQPESKISSNKNLNEEISKMKDLMKRIIK